MELKKISSVSARKLKCLAQLDSETFKLGSTQQGNFQLELITNSKYDNGPDRKWTKRIIVQCVSILKVLLQGLHQNKFVLISNGIQWGISIFYQMTPMFSGKQYSIFN